MKRKKILAISGALCLTFSTLVLASCNTSTDVVEEVEDEISLSATTNTLKVGETATIEVSTTYDKTTLLWVSEDESVVTVSGGTVTAVGEGKAKVYAYPKENFDDYTYVEFIVTSEATAGETINELAIDATNVKKDYKLGENLDLTGLVVTVDGAEVSNYSTNPRNGTTLQVIGEMGVVVSYSGCESVSFTIKVEENPIDTTLYDLAEKLSTTKNYKYDVELFGKIEGSDGTIQDGSLKYSYTFNETKFYLKFTALDEIYEDYDFGYVNTEKGVMKYKIVDEIVTPICYESHQKYDYREVSAYKDENVLTLEGFPLRQTSGYYLVTDNDLINDIVSKADSNASIVYNNMKSVKGYVISETAFKFVVDCGNVGHLEVTYSDIGTADVNGVEQYLTDNGDEIAIDSELTTIFNKINANNYTIALGTFTNASGVEKNAGYKYYTENYYVYLYEDEYIEYYNANAGETAKEIASCGQFIKDDVVYDFTIGKNDNNEPVIETVNASTDTIEDSYLNGGYISTFDALDEANIDMYAHETITNTTLEGYVVTGDSLTYDFYDYLGLSLETFGVIPAEFALYHYKGTVEALDQIGLIEIVFDMSGKYYALATYLTNLGYTSCELVEDYMAAME